METLFKKAPLTDLLNNFDILTAEYVFYTLMVKFVVLVLIYS